MSDGADDTLAATTSFHTGVGLSREQVASPYDNSSISDYINTLIQRPAPTSASTEASGDDVFAERHFHDEDDVGNEAAIFSNTTSNSVEQSSRPLLEERVASQYRSALQDTSVIQTMNRSLLASDRHMRTQSQNPDEGPTPVETPSPVPCSGDALPSWKKMYKWKKPPHVQNPSEPLRFHGSEPVSIVVEKLLKQDTVKQAMVGVGARGEACRDQSRPYGTTEHQPISIFQAAPRSLQDTVSDSTWHDDQPHLHPGHKEKVRRYYPLKLPQTTNQQALQDVMNNNISKNNPIPIDPQLPQNSVSITFGNILPEQAPEVPHGADISRADLPLINPPNSDLESRLLAALEGEKHTTSTATIGVSTMASSENQSDGNVALAIGSTSRKRAISKVESAKPTKRANVQKEDPSTTASKKRGGRKNANNDENIPSKAKSAPKATAKRNAKKKCEVQENREKGFTQAEKRSNDQASSSPEMAKSGLGIQDDASSIDLHISSHQTATNLAAENGTPISARRTHQREFSRGSAEATAIAGGNMNETLQRETTHPSTMIPVTHGHGRTSSYGAMNATRRHSFATSNNATFLPPYHLAAQYSPANQLYRPQPVSSMQTTVSAQRAFNNGPLEGQLSTASNYPLIVGALQARYQPGHQRAGFAEISGLINIDQSQVLRGMQRFSQDERRRIASARLSPAIMGGEMDANMQVGERPRLQDLTFQVRIQPIHTREMALSSEKLQPNKQHYQEAYQSTGADRCSSEQSLPNADILRQTASMSTTSGAMIPASANGNVTPQTSIPAQYRGHINMQDILFEAFPMRNFITAYGRRELPPWYERPVYTDRSSCNYAGIQWPFYYRTIAIEEGQALYTFTDEELDHLLATAELDTSGLYDWGLITDDLIAEFRTLTQAPAVELPVAPSTHVDTSRDSSAMLDTTSNTSPDDEASTPSQSGDLPREFTAFYIAEGKDQDQ